MHCQTKEINGDLHWRKNSKDTWTPLKLRIDCKKCGRSLTKYDILTLYDEIKGIPEVCVECSEDQLRERLDENIKIMEGGEE